MVKQYGDRQRARDSRRTTGGCRPPEIESLEVRCYLSGAGALDVSTVAELGDATDPPPPNVLLIVSDDQRADSFRVMARTRQELAHSGVRFRNAFVTTAQCCPSRASILTGRYAHNHGVIANAPPRGGFTAFHDSETLATWLHDAGYRTGLYGKYLNHFRPKPKAGYVPPGWDEFHAFDSRFHGRYVTYALSENGVTRQYGPDAADYSTDVLARKSIEFIQAGETNDDQPFFLYFAPFAPHRPSLPALRHANRFADLPAYRPAAFNEEDVGDKPAWLRLTRPLSADEIAQLDRQRRNYYASLLAVDEAIGELVDTLRETNEWGNTVILFLSDNGLHWGEHRQFAKATAYTEALHVPLVIRDGRDPTKRVSDALVLNIDITPTILELAGLQKPVSVDGRSLAPLVHGEPVQWRTDFLIEHWKPGQEHVALRTDRWLYVEYQNGDRELYDLVADRDELQSRHDDDSLSEIRSTLSQRLQLLMTCAGAACSTMG